MNNPDKKVSVLALNPSVDISYSIQQLLEYQKVRARQTWYHAGGNGINIARALTELAVPAYCCSIIAGESGDLLLKLIGDSLGDRHKYFRVPGETRLNTTLLQQSPPGQYEITSTGPEIPAEVLAEVCQCLLEVNADGIAVLSGLLPPGVPDSTYHDMVERINKQGGKAVVDTHGEVLQQALAAKPWMVRVNQHILEMQAKQRMDSVEEIAAAGRMIQQQGINYVCVTLGRRGAVLVTGDNSYYCDAPNLHMQSTVGCGDSLLTGLIAGALNGDAPQQMLSLGVSCGSATASHPGTELFKRDELDAIIKDIEVKSLDI
ncbi:MAG: hexose kinase [Gammaproteobacteria bacterium]